MKRVWMALILLLVIAGIAGALVYLNQEEPFVQDRTLYSYPDQAVEEIRIVSGDGEVFFDKKQDGWVMVKPRPYKIDAGTVGMLENRLKDFLASRILEEDTDDLRKYGLDEPTASIHFKLDDGTENTLLIGEMTASKVQYYAKDSAGEKIYILGSYDVENFLRPASEFRDRTILAIDTGAINALSLDAYGKREFKLVSDDAGKWAMTEPLKTEARGDAVDELLRNVLELRIKDFVTESADGLSRYGLDEPAYTLEIKDKAKKDQTVYFGSIDEEKQVAYIRLDDYEEVYTLSLEAFDPRRYKIAGFLNEAPLSVSIMDVDKVTIIEGDSAVEFVRDAQTPDAFTSMGKMVNQEDFTTLYVNIMALTAEGYDPENKGGTADLTVILALKEDSQTIRAEFVKRDESSYFIILNGEPKPFYLYERKVDLIKWWRDRILENT